MTEKFPHDEYDHDPSPQVSMSRDGQLEAFTQSEIDRTTAPLHHFERHGHYGSSDISRKLGEHVVKVTNIIRDNPERVEVDMDKSPHKRTEHDPERAHLAALAIDKNMTRLARDAQREKDGKRIWNRTRHQRDMLGARLGESMANEEYDFDPPEAGHATVELAKRRRVFAGYKQYKMVDGAKYKLPKR